jgi:hypothetical protein
VPGLKEWCQTVAMKPRTTFNPKRRLAPLPESSKVTGELEHIADTVRYGGNPEHKFNPGDFGLTPPSDPRPGKTLCDIAGILSKDMALDLLKNGIKKGLVSVQERNGFPQNVWAVTEDDIALEAQLENAETGQYHGYPMLPADPLREQVVERWGRNG